jgi:endo-1,4-beta-D-glucanase Y
MAAIKELRWGFALVLATTLGCSSGSPAPAASSCQDSTLTACTYPDGAQRCTNTKVDASNCGTCGNVCTGSNNVCQNGACVASTSTVGGGTSTTNRGGNSSVGGQGSSIGGTSTSSSTGGTSTSSSGGTSSKGGSTSTGGTTSTSSTSNGGSPAGGTSSKGGSSAGGASTGGTSTSSNGGGSVGGSSPQGGSSSGGASVGGNPAGGNSAGGASGAGGTSVIPANGDIISDFEDTPGKGTVKKVVSTMDGYWYSFKDTTCGAQTPAAVSGAAVSSEQLPTSDSRASATNKYAMHSTVTSCPTYSGFGAELHPTSSDGKKKGAVDLSAWDGVTFWIKGTSSSMIYVEFQTTDCTDAANGGTAVSSNSDAFNCHGGLLKTIPTSWTQVWVPFGTTGVRWFPTSKSGGTTTCTTSEFCEAPPLNRKNIVDIQFALESPFNEKPTAVTSSDVWIDDLALYKFSDSPANSGLAPLTQTGAFPFPGNKDLDSACTKPSGADGKLLQDAYKTWKSKFVSGDHVVSPEIDNGATVSEGMGYGMLLAVYFGDQPLFDGLLAYWKAHGSSKGNMLMNWKIGGSGGTGSATDADEDTAFALQMAKKQWAGGKYDADAGSILAQFLAVDTAGGKVLPGSDFSGKDVANPSYFAPAFYRYFATVDTANASAWNALITNGYTQLANISGSKGLVPAWCTSNCSTAGSGGLNYDDETAYQYDSHRTPWRVGLDLCWNGASAASGAKAYLDKVVGFFAGLAGAPGSAGGISSIADNYTSSGSVNTAAKNGYANNSMSLLGCAGVGAMGSSATNAASFRDRVWSFLLEGHYTQNYMYTNGDSSTKPGYTYYNATVGLLTALTMSGNFYILK